MREHTGAAIREGDSVSILLALLLLTGEFITAAASQHSVHSEGRQSDSLPARL